MVEPTAGRTRRTRTPCAPRFPVLLAALLLLSGSATSSRADAFAEFVDVRCIPPLGALRISTTVVRGERALFFPAESRKALADGFGLVAWDGDGLCSIDGHAIRWVVKGIGSSGRGQCGAAFQGYLLTLEVDGRRWIDSLRMDRACPELGLGPSYQVLDLGMGPDAEVDELRIEGVWAAPPQGREPARPLSLPITTEQLDALVPACDRDAGPDSCRSRLLWLDSLLEPGSAAGTSRSSSEETPAEAAD